LKDSQEHVEAPRSIVRESKPLKKFPNFLALTSNVIEETTNHQVYQDAMMQDDVWPVGYCARIRGTTSSKWLF
jgi:hypothetical protein